MHLTFTHPEHGPAHAVDALVAAGFVAGDRVALTRTVLDTFDGRLHAAGLRVELRRSRGAELVLLGPGDAPPAGLQVAVAPTFATDLPAGPFRARVAAVIEERALLPMLTLSARATLVAKRDGRGKATVAVAVLDDLEVGGERLLDGPTWAAEVQGVAGHGLDVDRTDDILSGVGLQRSPGDAVTLVAAAAGIDLTGRSSSPTVPLEPDAPALDAFRGVLANLAASIDDNLAGTVADTDPEFLHELRVAVRRTRSVLAQGKGVLPADVRDRFREVFGWLGTVTGPARDLDVYILGWSDYVAELPLAQGPLDLVRAEVEGRRQEAHRVLAEALQSAAYSESMADWHRWLADDVTLAPDGALDPIGPYIAGRISKAQRALLEHGRAIGPESPSEQLHDLRKDAKKLRYLLECFGSLFDPKPRKAFVSRLKALQDNLGDHQDAEVQVAQLRDLARDLHARGSIEADVLLAMGQLTEQLDRRRQVERDAFAARFADYDAKATRRSLDALLDPVARVPGKRKKKRARP